MGLFDRLGLGRDSVAMHAVRLPIVSPYQAAPELPPFVITDLLSDETVKNLPMGRSQAITIPAVSKARNLLVSTIAKFPLRAMRLEADGTDKDVTTEHPWLYRTNNSVTPYERMAWTVDDMIFHGASLWILERSTSTVDGRKAILNAEWCPPSLWTITEGTILVDGQEAREDEVILFNSPFEGLLSVGGRTLKGGRDQEAAWVGRARNPIPLIDLHRTDDDMTDDEVRDLVKDWATARTSDNGAIGSTPPSIEIRTYGEVKADLMTEGRNAVRTDIGSFLNIRAAMLDGTVGIDSLTYTTKEGERNAFYEFDLPFWTDPIEARLSMDDVVPRGSRVRFNKYDTPNLPNTPTPTTGTPVED